MVRRVSKFESSEQPLQWTYAIFCGAVSAIFMMSFIDIFYMMGITPFTYEDYIGSLIHQGQYGGQVWTIGFLANLVIGSLFGILYAYCFEYPFKRATPRLGIWLGVWHTLAAAFALFPFFNAIHEFMGIQLYSNFGILGSGLGLQTTILLITGHLLFGVCMGLFYGPVGLERVRAKEFEPGETGVPPSSGGISREEDPEDRAAS